MAYPGSMLIRSSLISHPRPARAALTQGQPVSFKETAIKATIVGASLGTVVGETVGTAALVSGGGYLGWRLGQTFGGGHPLAAAAGAVIGTGASLFLEKKLPIGGTLGSVGGFLTGGLIGGTIGSVIGGVQAVANSDLFEKR